MGLPDHFKRDRVPFWKASPRTWPIIVEMIAGREWPSEVVDDDLWWWMDQVVNGYATDIPSRRALMARWTWTERRVRDRLQVLGDWRAEWTSQRGPSEVPARSQRGPSEVPTDNRQTSPISEKGPSEVPARSQRGPSEVPARSTRAVEQSTETDVQNTDVHEPPADPPPAIREPVLVSPVERPPVADDWTQLAEHYAGLGKWARKPVSRSKKGNGMALATILREVGSLATARLLLDWWAYADDDRASFLRYGKDRRPDPAKPNAPPDQGLVTVARHAEDYLERAIAWQARGSPRQADRDRRARGEHGSGYAAGPSPDDEDIDF